jgi:phospholipase/lecithinase/hemolysin
VDKAVEELGIAGENQIWLAFRPDAMIRTKSEHYGAAAIAAGRRCCG